MSDIVERLRYNAPADHGLASGDLMREAADEIELLRAERDNWGAICAGSLKEQFRLARENEARLKLALDQLDKAAAEIGRRRTAQDQALGYLAEAPPRIADARRALEQARKA